jgi:hypothetical protein
MSLVLLKSQEPCFIEMFVTLFKLDYSEQFYPNQSFARFENPGVMAQRLISKD